MQHRITVLFPAPLACYDYKADTELPVGTFVMAPFGRKKTLGVVWDKKANLSFDESKVKSIDCVLDISPLPMQTISFVNWVAGYTLAPLGMVLKMVLIPEMEKISKKPLVFDTPLPDFKHLTFSPEQQTAANQITTKINNGFCVSLLDGVTGSGKTEVYFEAVASAIKANKQILVLLPEIILTTAWLGRFEGRFGVRPALWHSSITPKQRRDTWQAVKEGKAQVIVGARSALFLPFTDLGLIIIDEEHDASFKQEDGVLYHARDMGIVRAKIAKCPILLASATPSLETYCNAVAGKYYHIHLPSRFAGAGLPDIEIVDMRLKEKGPITFVSPKLKMAIAENLQKGEQSLLFINRRGYAPLILCRTCGERLKCPYCSAWLVEHKRGGYAQCHHCGYTIKRPDKCPCCNETDSLVSCGPGVERIYEEITQHFPDARSEMVTSDTLNNPSEFKELIEKITNNELDIIIGTQMLAKGHHFSNLTLVGVIDADMGLAGGDLRAAERTFQLLHQVMGRAGREKKKGRAFLQSYVPDNLIIKALKNNDRSAFLNEEIAARQLLNMPPFGKLAGVIFSGRDETLTYQIAKNFVSAAPFIDGLDVLGPVAAPLAKLRGKFRFRVLIKTTKDIKLQSILSHWMTLIKHPTSVDIRLDIDPYSFF
ncbi:MAG: primosomal protein N' [Alphaproteobacteria bacterium]|nr:primosomal protein N' [Alphaproteobacteria bacterium]